MGEGGIFFWCGVTFVCDICTSVSQFHPRWMQMYRGLLRDRFSLGPLYSLVVEEELVNHHLKWEKEVDRRVAESRDWGEGCGVGAVVQRWRGKCPDSAGGGIGRRVTGLYDITSCPSAFPVTCPPHVLVPLQRCCRSLQTLIVMFGEYCGDTERGRSVGQNGFVFLNRGVALQIWLTLSLWKGFRKFPPISPSSRGVPGWLFILKLPGEFWGGEKGAKVN